MNKTVFVSGHFNVLHPGHVRLLRFAKECGNKLIVAVESDRLAEDAAHVPEALRLEGVMSNSWVDEVILIDEPVTSVISRIKPDIVVKGKEHESKFNPELKVLEHYGGKLLFSSGETFFSSTDLLHKELKTSKSIRLPKEFMDRHNIDSSKLLNLINEFSKLKVCVIGDLIIDEYITCQPLGMSQEDPTIVVTPVDAVKFIGGAGIVAAHGSGLGATVQFITVTGSDTSREFADIALSKFGVKANLLLDETRPTTLKQRYRCQGKSLLRVSHLHQGAISLALQAQLLNQIEEIIQESNLLIFSDFNYGCLPQSIVDKIISIAKTHNVLLVADSQSSSQIGDIARFSQMDLITPTEREARISTRNKEDGLVVLADRLRQQSNCKNILLTLGEDGLLIHSGNIESSTWHTDRVEALNTAPKDVAGAGDSLLIASALTLASGGNIWEAAVIGSLAAALQVSRIGNIPLSVSELANELG